MATTRRGHRTRDARTSREAPPRNSEAVDARVSLLWTVTVFLGSALLFVIQPMIARMLLPRVGGAPSTWTTCVLFFQAVLLAGYLYAHWVGRHGARTQLAIHAALLLLPLGMLPFSIVSGAPGTGPLAPTLWLLRALALAIGPPFFVIAAGAPLLQKWLAGSRLPGSGDPYVLYAASNAGSLTALAAYPILIEPALGLARQAVYWAGGYALYVVLALTCAVRAARASASAAPEANPAANPEDEPPYAARQRWQWVALAAAPSSLMLGVTSLLTADAAGLPFLWVLPLALYLLSFVVAFARRAEPSRLWARLLPICAVVFMLLWMIKGTEPLALILGAYLAVFFVAAMACHTELARRRPPPRHLTACTQPLDDQGHEAIAAFLRHRAALRGERCVSCPAPTPSRRSAPISGRPPVWMLVLTLDGDACRRSPGSPTPPSSATSAAERQSMTLIGTPSRSRPPSTTTLAPRWSR